MPVKKKGGASKRVKSVTAGRRKEHAGERESGTGSGITVKVIDLLETVAMAGRSMSIPEMVERCGLATPTAHRIVRMLLEMGLVERDAERRYHGGQRLLALSFSAIASAAQRSTRQLILESLSQTLGENCHFCIMDGGDTLSIAYAEARQTLSIRLQPGMRLPLHSNAAGKMLLATMTDELRERLIASLDLKALTAQTITSLERLKDEVETAARRRYATAISESLDGVAGIAVPVKSTVGKAIGVLLVTAPTSRKSPRELVAALPRIRDAADVYGATY